MKTFFVGDTVTYIPRHARLDYSKRELGKVTSVNDRYVFVDHKACNPDDLLKGDETFYCHDEHNSILDSAFGRCPSECNKCRELRQFLQSNP